MGRTLDIYASHLSGIIASHHSWGEIMKTSKYKKYPHLDMAMVPSAEGLGLCYIYLCSTPIFFFLARS